MPGTLTQMFPPKATFKLGEIPPQQGRIFMVTGGYSGVGYHVSKALFNAGGTVYIAGRSREKAEKAIKDITQSLLSQSPGQLEFLEIHLDDLDSVRQMVKLFQAKETRLDVLFNNAGVSGTSPEQKSKQGFELQLATNCLGPLLLTIELLPQLKNAKSSRVVWASSQIMELNAPKGGVKLSDLSSIPQNADANYTNSKTGNYFLASEFARRYGSKNNILSIAINPGALKTELLRHRSWLFRQMVSPLMYPAENGGLTTLYAGLSPELSIDKHSGAYIIPWGRVHPSMRGDLLRALVDEKEGGTGEATKFWDECEDRIGSRPPNVEVV